MKKNIAIIFGGNSTEHDISILSAIQFANAVNKKKFEIFPICILHSSKWLFGKELLNLETYKDFDKKQKRFKEVAILPSSQFLFKKSFGVFKKMSKIDCAVLALHGKNGEDGTVQGLLELAGIPYTSSGVLGSSVGIDKDMMKQIFLQNKIPVIKYVCISKNQFDAADFSLDLITSKIGFPLVVKPNRLGSSIGISICKNNDELLDALSLAFLFDEKVVIEKCVENLKEVNISVLGNGENCEVSLTEEVNNKNGLLTFQKKYCSGAGMKGAEKLAVNKNKKEVPLNACNVDEKLNEEKNKNQNCNSYELNNKSRDAFVGTKNGMQNIDRIVPANISKNQIKKIEFLAKKIFAVLNSKGVVRIDFIIDQNTGKVYANEINTIPGSFAFYLWQNKGIDFEKLTEALIDIAIQDCKQQKKLITKFSSNVL